MLHELGHLFGLVHTTESSMAIHDPLDDTEECTAGMRTCPDGSNIMFWSYYGASGGVGVTASDEQRAVV